MSNYILAQQDGRANFANRLFYCMEESDKATMLQNDIVHTFDRVYVIKTQKTYILGTDSVWYEAPAVWDGGNY